MPIDEQGGEADRQIEERDRKQPYLTPFRRRNSRQIETTQAAENA